MIPWPLSYRFYLFCVIALCSTSAISVTINDPIYYQTSCFRGDYENFESLEQRMAQLAPEYKQVWREAYQKTEFEQRQRNLDCRDFMYMVDGSRVRGFIVQPKEFIKEGKYPVVIYLRGGNAGFGDINFHTIYDWLMPLAEEGYIVIGTNYRHDDEFIGADMADVHALFSILEQMPTADMDRIALWGVSRGAPQAILTAIQNPSIKTVVFSAGFVDAEQLIADRPVMERVFRARVPNFEQQRMESLRKRSIIHVVEQIPAKTSILIAHGEQDQNVSVEHAFRLADKLQQQNHSYEMKIYRDAEHYIFNESFQDIVDWLRVQLQ